MSPEPLDRSATWPFEEGEPGPFFYSRYGHPVGAEAERRLGDLDGGRALLFGSGSAASAAVVLGLLSPGSTVAVAAGCYFGTPLLLELLGRWGIHTLEFDQTGPPPDKADLIWLEAPSNPLLSFPDLEAAAAHPAPVLVDATASSPVLLRPLEHGADLVLHSATKYLGGHSDVLLGAVVCRHDEDFERLLVLRSRTGSVAAADPAWLLLRSLATLELRVRQQSATALELARRLEADPRVERVRYPGLGDPRAARYMEGGFGGLLSFDVADEAAARRVETSTEVIVNATSLGGVVSSIESRHRWEGDRVPPGLLRLSVGLEDGELLWADLDQALGAASRVRAAPAAPVVGVDGYRGGWVAALLDRRGTRVVTSPSFREIAALDACVIAVDIPIGIPESSRDADSAARRFVGPRASSVFTTPPRPALEAQTYAEALERARELTGRGISQQSFALRHRILEVDAFSSDTRIIEVHPEVSFAELAGEPLPHSKHSTEGLILRRRLLVEAGIDVPVEPLVPEADLLDALVAAWTAARYLGGEAKPLPDGHADRIGAIWR